jgi:flagellar biosynthesis protein FliR
MMKTMRMSLKTKPHSAFSQSILGVVAGSVYYQVQSDVAYVSHIIGFTLGLPLGIAWSPQWKRNLLILVGLLGAYFVLLFLITTYLLPALR